MSEPAFCNVSGTEATAAKIRGKADAAAIKIRGGAETTLRAVLRFRERFQDRSQQVSGCIAETRTRIPAIKQKLREGAARVAGRARYYHQTRPLNTLGVIAAAGFALGIAIGLGRR